MRCAATVGTGAKKIPTATTPDKAVTGNCCSNTRLSRWFLPMPDCDRREIAAEFNRCYATLFCPAVCWLQPASRQPGRSLRSMLCQTLRWQEPNLYCHCRSHRLLRSRTPVDGLAGRTGSRGDVPRQLELAQKKSRWLQLLIQAVHRKLLQQYPAVAAVFATA